MSAARVAVVADDLIWGTRLVELVRTAGADPLPCRTRQAFEGAIPASRAALVDLSGRSYDGIELIALARKRGVRVLAIGQHDDAALRSQARAAGAERVLAYRALAEGGPVLVGGWLADDGAIRPQTGSSATGAASE